MSNDLFDSVVNAAADRPPFKQAPPGDYLAVVREAKKVKSGQKGTPGIELTFTLKEEVGNSGADMEGVDLARCRLNDTLWVTENTIAFVTEKLGRITSEAIGLTLTDAIDVLPGNEVVVRLKHQTENSRGETLNIPRLEVTAYYSMEWYFNNKKAA